MMLIWLVTMGANTPTKQASQKKTEINQKDDFYDNSNPLPNEAN